MVLLRNKFNDNIDRIDILICIKGQLESEIESLNDERDSLEQEQDDCCDYMGFNHPSGCWLSEEQEERLEDIDDEIKSAEIFLEELNEVLGGEQNGTLCKCS